MEENRTDIISITKAWEKLRYELKKNNKVPFDAFEDTFTKTYLLFREIQAEALIDKKLISLIISASLFANSPNPESDFICSAMFAMTERMLTCCALTTSSEPVSGTTVYVFETQKEVCIDFGNVKDSVNRLVCLFREEYWDSL